MCISLPWALAYKDRQKTIYLQDLEEGIGEKTIHAYMPTRNTRECLMQPYLRVCFSDWLACYDPRVAP